MKPLYIYGDNYPTISQCLLRIIAIIFLPIPLTYWLFDIMLRYQSPIPFSFIVGYCLFFFIMLLLMSINSSKGIYLFYNHFMLYKKRLSLKDKFSLAFMKKDISKLETYLEKCNYVTIESLSIDTNEVHYMRSSDVGIMITFILRFNDHTVMRFTSFRGEKEDYLAFLHPFLQYHIQIYDPHNVMQALQQNEMRILDYIQANK